MTRKWYATLRHPKMYPHTKFGIPTPKNIGDMDRTRKRDGRTDGRTVRLLYASQSSFGGIKKKKKKPTQFASRVSFKVEWPEQSITKQSIAFKIFFLYFTRGILQEILVFRPFFHSPYTELATQLIVSYLWWCICYENIKFHPLVFDVGQS